MQSGFYYTLKRRRPSPLHLVKTGEGAWVHRQASNKALRGAKFLCLIIFFFVRSIDNNCWQYMIANILFAWSPCFYLSMHLFYSQPLICMCFIKLIHT